MKNETTLVILTYLTYSFVFRDGIVHWHWT